MVEERTRYTLDQINQMTLLPYARTMAAVFANASWVPVLAFPHRPFLSLEHLHQSMTQVLIGSDENSKLQVIEQQPDLVNPPAPNEEANEFQLFHCDRAFAQNLSDHDKLAWENLQKAYLEKFAFPLVFDPSAKSIPQLTDETTTRIGNPREEELKRAIVEASKLALSRLQELIVTG